MLPVFPSAYIDDSLLTAVFVGVLLLWWLTERFGWPTTGLVVPGYLGAILAIRPDAALVVAVEAIATYLVADFVGRRLQKWLPLDIAFGRDRFFLIILASIFVRLAAEVWPGPDLLFAAGFDRADGWHSIGLVLVPLTANALWKPGIAAGVPIVALPVLAVFLLLRFVLLPFTNLSLVTLELTYADLEWSFLGAPRVYLLLVVGAFLASHATVRFGWDFGGIIVCGLLAIAWLDPITVMATFAEVLVVVAIVRGLVSVRPLKTVNLSGMRPIVLAFTVSYAVKLLIASVGQGIWPSFTTSDLFGFGYLLPALLATRVWRQGQVLRILVPTILVSLSGFLLGTTLGALLSFISPDVGEAMLDESGDRPGPAWMVAMEAVVQPMQVVRRDVRDEAAIAIALANSGRPYRGRSLRVDEYADGFVLDGSGTGIASVLWRKDGRDGVEVWAEEAWRPGVAEAALSIAERVGASRVVLGDPTYVQGVHRRQSTRIRVSVGEQSSWTGPAGLTPAVMDLVERVSQGDDAELVLDDNGIAFAASELMVGLQPPRRSVVDTATWLSAYERGVAWPALRAHDDIRWRAIAGAWAFRVGVQLQWTEDGVRVVPPEEGPYAVGIMLLDGEAPVVVEVREPFEDLVAVGASWAETSDARALMVVQDFEATDIARVWWRVLAMEQSGLQGVSIARLRYDDLAGGDAVVYDGRAVSPVHEPRKVGRLATSLVEDAGFSVVYGDASSVRARFHDGGDRRRASVEPFDGALATVWVSQRLRQTYSGLEPGSPFALALAASDIQVEELDVRGLIRGQPLTDGGLDDTWQTLARYATTGHPGALARMVADLGPSATVSATSDPITGRALIVVQHNGRVGVAPLGYSGQSVNLGEWTLPAVWRAQ